MPSRRPSRKRPWNADHPELDVERARGGVRHVDAGDGQWTVRRVTGDKPYTCPACHQQIAPGTPHVVAWQRDVVGGEAAGLEARRHWHSSCFDRRQNLR